MGGWRKAASSSSTTMRNSAVLAVVAVASLGLLALFLRSGQREPVTWYRLSVAGLVLFCWQTVVPDGIVWPFYFPL